MPDTPTFGRYAEIPYDQMTPEQQEGYHSLVETRGPLGGPNRIWVHNPGLAKVMGPLGAYFRTGYSLSEREREIAVIIINSKWHSAYPTNALRRRLSRLLIPCFSRQGTRQSMNGGRRHMRCHTVRYAAAGRNSMPPPSE